MKRGVMGNTLEELLECANSARVVNFDRVNGETITFQIGRVVYSMSRQRAGAFLRDALQKYHRPAWAGEEGASDAEQSHDTVHKALAPGSVSLKTWTSEFFRNRHNRQRASDATEPALEFVARADASVDL